MLDSMKKWHNFVHCPACRGYSLERQWCGHCGGKGVVNGGAGQKVVSSLDALQRVPSE